MPERKNTPKLQVEYLRIEDLKPYSHNPRKHSPEQVAQINSSIGAFGWTTPVLIDDGNEIIAGHGRIEAAVQRGMSTVPVLRLSNLTPAQIKAYRIADNRLTELGVWDHALLVGEIEALKELDFDIDLTGFGLEDLEDMEELLGEEGGAGKGDPDDAPEPPEEPTTQPGDVYLMGKHRLICGDSTDADTVKRVLNGATPALMVTDPPYGVNYDADWRKKAGVNKTGSYGYGMLSNDDRADWADAFALFPGTVAYVWHADLRAKDSIVALLGSGFELRAQIVWGKAQLVIGQGHYHFQHEPCWYAVRKGKTADWAGDRKQTTLWEIDKPRKSETGHSTQKPIECMERPIRNHKGDVYDPFVGSGTTLIAAERQRRTCYAIEISPAYCDVAAKRWQAFTGKEAVLEATGKSPF